MSLSTQANVLSLAPSAVGIVGLGAIGSSIGLALRREGLFVIGNDRSARHLEQAMRMGAIARVSPDLNGFGACRAVFVSVPPRDIVEVSRRLLQLSGAIVIDVGSIKGQIAEALRDPRFVPSHPLKGTHLSGPGAAREDLFAGATWAVCPTAETSVGALDVAETLIRRMGARPVCLEPAEHDRLVARTSHLPHVAATALVHVFGERNREIASRLIGKGFLDTTRIARAAPSLWADIALNNRSELGESIGELIDRLEEIERALERGDHREVTAFFHHGTEVLEGLPTPRLAATSPTTAGRIGDLVSVGRGGSSWWDRVGGGS